jgi:hypothetical protein
MPELLPSSTSRLAIAREASETAPAPMMVEVDLLPSWYPLLLRRRRRLHLQAWLTGALVVVLVAVLVWHRASEEATQVELASLEAQRRATDATLSELALEEARLAGLLRRAELVSRMGLPVEVSRVISQIDAAVPEDVALTALDVVTDEQSVAAPGLGLSAGATTHARLKQMQFTLVGYADNPTSIETLGRNLRKLPLLRDVRPSRTRSEIVFNQSVMLFEMSFRVDLTAGGGGGALSEAKGGFR